jgi:probable HAF family extracellular repeat protein
MSKLLNFILCVCLLVVTVVSLASGVQAQTQQASCTFHTFSLTQSPRMITVTGVNDYGTVVGYADFGEGASRQEKAFIHYSGGGSTYWLPSGAKNSAFGGRNDDGVTTGAYGDSSNHTDAFLLKGSTLTPIVRPYGAGPGGINKYNSVVGTYIDGNGNAHGFKRYSDGNVIHLTYPGALGTRAYGINDTSTIVGFYNGTDSAEHGFIYKNGQWASLQFPNATQSTELYGISNSNVIVGQGQAHGYMYNDGTFKEIAVPGSAETQVRAIAPGGLIAGMADLTHGFLASCH